MTQQVSSSPAVAHAKAQGHRTQGRGGSTSAKASGRGAGWVTNGQNGRRMDVTADLDAPCPTAQLFSWVATLERYTRWLDIVAKAVPADPHPDDTGPAWQVDLRGRLGPLARSKRLRMVRTTFEEPTRVTFERVEQDGRDHSPWVLDATVAELVAGEGSRLTMRLHYGGSLWGPVLERLLGDEISKSRERLLACVAGEPQTA